MQLILIYLIKFIYFIIMDYLLIKIIMQYFYNIAFSSRFPNWHEMGIYEQAIWWKVIIKE